jgi:hypothetical protein
MRTSQRLGLLAGLGDGSIRYTHAVLDALPAGTAADHLRGVLVTAGVLPPDHRTAERLQAWLDTRLADMDDGPDKDLVRQFARWHHLRLIRRHGADRDAAFGSYVSAKQSITATVRFLEHLHQRGISPAHATQDDLSAWLRVKSTHQRVEQFIAWARRTGRLPALRNEFAAKTVAVMTTDEQRRHLRTLVETEDLPLDLRAAGLLVLVYGATVTQIAGLPREAINPGPPMTLTLATAPVPVPAPVAAVLRQHLDQHRGPRTLGGAPSDWLFPGTAPSSHLHRQTLAHKLQQHGIPVRAARNRALQHLVTTARRPSWPTCSATPPARPSDTTSEPPDATTGTPQPPPKPSEREPPHRKLPRKGFLNPSRHRRPRPPSASGGRGAGSIDRTARQQFIARPRNRSRSHQAIGMAAPTEWRRWTPRGGAPQHCPTGSTPVGCTAMGALPTSLVEFVRQLIRGNCPSPRTIRTQPWTAAPIPGSLQPI